MDIRSLTDIVLSSIVFSGKAEKNITEDGVVKKLDPYQIKAAIKEKKEVKEEKPKQKEKIEEKPADLGNELRIKDDTADFFGGMGSYSAFKVDLTDLSADDYGGKKEDEGFVFYKEEQPKVRPQELWEKEGFYQEKTTQARVRVQIWPEHLPYDHFKRKRAFLFC